MTGIAGYYRSAVETRARGDAAISLYHTGQRARAQFATGVAGLHREGRWARHEDATGLHTIVGGPLFHTVGDRLDAINKLGTEFALLQNDLSRELGWTEAKPTWNETDPKYGWWKANAQPVLEEWQRFQADHQSWGQRFLLNWDALESWQDRLEALRVAAENAGFSLVSPPPQPLPTTLPTDAMQGLKGLLSSLWSLVRVIVYAALAFAGGWGLWTMYREIKGL
jgi:hypothetical protein